MTNSKSTLSEQLAKEQDAWRRLCAAADTGAVEPAVLAEWLSVSRMSTEAKHAAIDKMLREHSVQRIKRVPLDALPLTVQLAVRRVLSGAEPVYGSDIGVCISDPAAGVFTCLAAQSREQVTELAGDLVDTGFALTHAVPAGCACDYVFDPIASSDE
jgi:hypothetical protein